MRRPEIETAARAHGRGRGRRRRRRPRPRHAVHRVHGRRAARPHRRVRRRRSPPPAPGPTPAPTGRPAPGPPNTCAPTGARRCPTELAALVAAWRPDDAYTGMLSAGGFDMPAESVAVVAIEELVVHGWDLARAIGRPYESTPAELAVHRRLLRPLRSGAARRGLRTRAARRCRARPDSTGRSRRSGRDPEWSPGPLTNPSARRPRRPAMPTITPNLWFDTQALEAAEFYTSVFPNSEITNVSHYTEAGPREAGMVLTVDFALDGQRYTAINGGPEFTFDRGGLAPRELHGPGRGRRVLGEARRRRRVRPVRLAQGPLRPLVADRPGRHGGTT